MFRNHHQCVGVTSNGLQCMNSATRESVRCKIHQNVVIKNGPNMTALLELEYKQEREIREIRERFQNVPGWDAMRSNEIGEAVRRHMRDKRELLDRQQEEVRRTGINPDREAEDRKEAQRIQRNELARQRRQQQDAIHMHHIIAMANQQVVQQPIQQVAVQQTVVQTSELRNISNDRESVHRTPVVNMLNETVNELLKIPVPEDYQWNMTTCSKTPGDIILKCKLSPKGAWQMQSQYCQDIDIYNMGKGIYGKVLDRVWQFILNSKDSDDLMKILKQEMEDNIGKCAQGNLTRLCNILGGYLEGIKIKETTAEVLGRKFTNLFEIENVEERVQTAYRILVDENVPQTEWLVWLNPLINDDDDETWYRIEIENDTSTGRVKLVEIPYEINYEG